MRSSNDCTPALRIENRSLERLTESSCSLVSSRVVFSGGEGKFEVEAGLVVTLVKWGSYVICGLESRALDYVMIDDPNHRSIITAAYTWGSLASAKLCKCLG